MAEYWLRRRMETDDMLRLLAGQAGAEGYAPPADRIAAALDDLDQPAPGSGDRAARVMQFVAAAGGDG